MENKKRILFIPGIPYLADPQFLAILPHLKAKGYELVYLYTGDSYSALMGKGDKKDTELLKERFDVYDETEPFYGYSELGQIGQLGKIKRFSRYINGVRKKLDQYRPDCIISCSDMGISQRTAIQWAKKNKIPFIILQAAFFDTDPQKYSLLSRLKYLIFNKMIGLPMNRKGNFFGMEDSYPYLFLWGNYFKKFYKKRDKVISSGNPKMDILLETEFQKNKADKNRKRKEDGIFRVLICSEDNYNLSTLIGESAVIKTMNLWKETMEMLPEFHFLVKPHPGENVDALQQYFTAIHNCTIDSDISLYDAFLESDVQISINSASSFEAIAAGIPVILTNLDHRGVLKNFLPPGIALAAEDVRDLTEKIKISMDNSFIKQFSLQRKDFLDNCLGSPEADNSVRTVSSIENIRLLH